ncbi:copper chaperone PCu(A)C [Haloglycomyces albus]|uniref:copper chaperone PCu(A)C n=1 Tax=Haloglycomyces albus TaxID=526067 RepID=UPI00046CDF7E|nr:copper chaperone PCu(A)C [Haloglycomyces albus]
MSFPRFPLPDWRRSGAVVGAVSLVLGVSACGGDDHSDHSHDDHSVSVDDAWVKATGANMSAVFGTITNDTDAEVVIESVESSVTDSVELHEAATDGDQSVMRPMEEPLTIASEESHTLEAGGDHIMLLALDEPIETGQEVVLTLNLAEGDDLEFTAVAKEFAGADEEYDPGHADDHGDGD